MTRHDGRHCPLSINLPISSADFFNTDTASNSRRTFVSTSSYAARSAHVFPVTPMAIFVEEVEQICWSNTNFVDCRRLQKKWYDQNKRRPRDRRAYAARTSSPHAHGRAARTISTVGSTNLSTYRDIELRYVRSTLKHSMFYGSIKTLFIRARS